MMSFSTPESVARSYPNQVRRLLNLPENADLSANDKLLWACDKANHEVEMYLGGVVKLPLPEPAESYPALVAHAIALAWWHLLQDRPETLTESDRANVRDAREFLKAVSCGKASLGLPPQSKRVAGAKIFRPTVSEPWSDF
jgi:phage gp36-like protein